MQRRFLLQGAALAQLLLLLLLLLLCCTTNNAHVARSGPRPAAANAKRANLWLSTADCCGHPSCGDLFDAAYGRAHGLENSYFESLRPWAATLDAILIDCGHRLSAAGALTLPNSTQQQRLSRATAEFAALNISVIPMVFADYAHADLGLDALSNSRGVADAFIATAVREARTHNYAGWNIDWEPCTGNTRARECGSLSAAHKWPRIPGILKQLAEAMAGHSTPGATAAPTVSAAGYACDVTAAPPTFSHCPYGNATIMNATDFRGSRLVLQTMGTYDEHPSEFDSFLAAGLANPGTENLGVGLNTAPNSAPHSIPRAEIQRRFRVRSLVFCCSTRSSAALI